MGFKGLATEFAKGQAKSAFSSTQPTNQQTHQPASKGLKKFVKKFGKGAVSKQFYIYETWLRWAARGLQFILALIVVGLYAHRVDKDRRANSPQSVAWVYAVFVSGLSCITCVVFAIPSPFWRSHRLFAWDLFLSTLWIAVFGTFARVFLPLKAGDPEYEGTDVRVMRGAVWLDLVNAIFWLGTGVYGCLRTFASKKIDAKINSLEAKVNKKVQDKQDKIAQKVQGKMQSKMDQYYSKEAAASKESWGSDNTV
ncbi:Uu.00g100470.m01.CDS01 [Anthostomella pinea]|uniref:Uu.00g100470.m01.CDS01 n=1 Tax=Anthostomella pinea TaxID=933095 RepID=A0AAI8YFC0_9PEZI|nr:Uu.00g100470.m01.CDS01 [Anthostomella pinea]